MVAKMKPKILTILGLLLAALIGGSLAVRAFDPLFAGYFTTSTTNDSELKHGKKLYEAHSCHTCHGANGDQPIEEHYPHLAGQNWLYTFNQLKYIRDQQRTSGHVSLMLGSVQGLSDADLQALAKYLAAQER